jgi:hypothetical protein
MQAQALPESTGATQLHLGRFREGTLGPDPPCSHPGSNLSCQCGAYRSKHCSRPSGAGDRCVHRSLMLGRVNTLSCACMRCAVGEDGRLSYISNWQSLTAAEKEVAHRRIAARSRVRRYFFSSWLQLATLHPAPIILALLPPRAASILCHPMSVPTS